MSNLDTVHAEVEATMLKAGASPEWVAFVIGDIVQSAVAFGVTQYHLGRESADRNPRGRAQGEG